MMRIGILGDTHGQMGAARKAIEQMGEVDAVLHTGDHYQDADELARQLNIPLVGVAGNCDWRGAVGPNELLLEYEGVRVFLTHGHLYRVRFGSDILLKRATELGAQVAVCGHTHIPRQEEEAGIMCFNPGSVATPRGGTKPSFGVLTIEQGQVYGEILTLQE